MKNNIILTVGVFLFFGFVTYATVQTQNIKENQILEQDASVSDDEKLFSLEDSLFTEKLSNSTVVPSSTDTAKNPVVPNVNIPVNTDSLKVENTEKEEYVKKTYYEDEDDRYEDEDEEEDDD